MTAASKKNDLRYIDELSGVYNRRYLTGKLDDDIKACLKKKTPFSLVIIDIDHFKKINDLYGHLKGDEVIREFAQFLQSFTRPYDKIIRYGGDEFVCFMPNSGGREAAGIYQRILTKCREKAIAGLTLTISIGIASCPEDGANYSDLFKVADNALYNAKRRGRNQIGSRRTKILEIPLKIFINRDKESEQLRTCLSRDLNSSRVAVVIGKVGIGKTRMVREVLNTVQGCEILWADCLSFAEDLSYYCLRELLKYKFLRRGKNILDDIPLVYQLEIGKLVPEIMDSIENQAGNVELRLDKYRLYESIRRLIEAGDITKIVVIDNLQWIDRESPEVIKYLLRALADKNITYIFICREEEKNDIYENFISFICREISLVEIRLEPLKTRDVKLALNNMIGGEPGSSLLRYIEELTGGNPLFIEEVIRSLSEGNYLIWENEDWKFIKPVKPVIPKNIGDITQHKYLSMTAEARQVLEIASVVGKFDVEMIKDLTGFNDGHVIGLIESISQKGLLKESRGYFVFSEEVSREAIYSRNLEGIRGQEYHRKIANILERQIDQNSDKTGTGMLELAHHYYRSRDLEKGAQYCILAGDSAWGVYANREALKYYTWAEELLKENKDDPKNSQRMEILLKVGSITNLGGDYIKAIDIYQDICRNSRQTHHKIKAMIKMANIHQEQGELDQAVKTLADAERMLVSCDSGAASMKIELYALRSWIYWLKGEMDDALTVGLEALDLVNKNLATGEKAKIIKIYSNLGIICETKAEYSKAIEYYDKSLKMAEAQGDKLGVSNAYNNLGLIYNTQGKYQMAIELFNLHLQISEEIGDKRGIGAACNNLGLVYSTMGDYDKAIDLYQKHLKISEETGFSQGLCIASGNLGDVYKNKGDFEKAMPLLQKYLSLSVEKGYKQITGNASSSLGDLYMLMGDYKQAEKLYRQYLRISTEVGDKQGIGIAQLGIGSLRFVKGNYIQALEHFVKYRDLSGEIGYKFGTAEAYLYIGSAYLELERYFPAARALLRSEKLFRELDNHNKIAAACLGLAEIQLRCSRKNDAPDRKQHLDKAQKYADRALDAISGSQAKISNPAIHLVYGQICGGNGNIRDSETNFNQAAKLYRENNQIEPLAGVYYQYGLMLQAAGKKKKAASYFEKARHIYTKLDLKHRLRLIPDISKY